MIGLAGLINELINNLDELNTLYEKLLESGNEKKQCVIKNDITALQAINDKENILVGKAIKLDKKRTELFDDIAFVLNKNPKEMTLSKLIEYIDTQAEAKDVKRVRDRAETLLSELKQLNEQNKNLIETSLDHAEFSMNLLRGSLSSRPCYYDTQGHEIPTGERLFDIKQ